jgi:hypothetical protein
MQLPEDEVVSDRRKMTGVRPMPLYSTLKSTGQTNVFLLGSGREGHVQISSISLFAVLKT